MFSEATCATLAVTKLRLAANKVPHRRATSPTSTGSKSHIDRQQVPHRRAASPTLATTRLFAAENSNEISLHSPVFAATHFYFFRKKNLTTSPNTPQSPIHKGFKASEVLPKHLTNTSLTLTWHLPKKVRSQWGVWTTPHWPQTPCTSAFHHHQVRWWGLSAKFSRKTGKRAVSPQYKFRNILTFSDLKQKAIIVFIVFVFNHPRSLAVKIT